MKYILSTSEAVDILRKDEGARWSYEAARALVEWHEQQEEELDEEQELDAVAIRCEWSEWTSALEAAQEQGYVPDEGSEDEDALKWLKDRTVVLEASNCCFVVMDF